MIEKLPALPWSQLRRINHVRLINSMYIWLFIVPISARLLENIGEMAELVVFGHTFSAQLTLPFSWVAFYFSALAFAAANSVYQIRCPSIIKEQSGYAEFRESKKGVEHLDRYLPEIDMNWEGLRQLLVSQDGYFDEIAEVSNPATDDGILRKRFWAAYAWGDKSRKIAKFIASTLYGVGGALLMYVLCQNVAFVINYLFAK